MRRPGPAGEGTGGEDDRAADENREGDNPEAGIEALLEGVLNGKPDAQEDADHIDPGQAIEEGHRLRGPALRGREDGEERGIAGEDQQAGAGQGEQVQRLQHAVIHDQPS
ncbi:MAG: hypothetical protein SVT56_13100 [Chloroflexota bacterium]|nr:hypothetical protein [Chloroflexota bacterium]